MAFGKSLHTDTFKLGLDQFIEIYTLNHPYPTLVYQFAKEAIMSGRGGGGCGSGGRGGRGGGRSLRRRLSAESCCQLFGVCREGGGEGSSALRSRFAAVCSRSDDQWPTQRS